VARRGGALRGSHAATRLHQCAAVESLSLHPQVRVYVYMQLNACIYVCVCACACVCVCVYTCMCMCLRQLEFYLNVASQIQRTANYEEQGGIYKCGADGGVTAGAAPRVGLLTRTQAHAYCILTSHSSWGNYMCFCL
jgi:hypothetical protein